MMVEKTKPKQFKSPNAYVIIFFILAFVAVLTWFIPGGQYQLDASGRALAGTYSVAQSNPQGLWNILMAPIIGMVGNSSITGAIAISLNIMLFGSFLEMMDKAGAIKIALKKIAIKNQHNYKILITVLVVVMGTFGTIQGAYEEGFVYLLMFLPIILALKLDTMVAVMIVVFGTQGGCLASIVNPFAVGIASSIAGISPGNGIIMRIIIFIVFMGIISFYICRYASKIQRNPTLSPQHFRHEEDKKLFQSSESNSDEVMTKEQRRILYIFCLTFIIMIISLIPWPSLNPSWTFFETFTKWLVNIPVIGMVVGKNMVPLGDWFFNEINALLIISTIISGYVIHLNMDQIINVIIKGAASLVSTAFIVPLARGIQVIMNEGSITPTILNFGENTLSSLSPVVFVIVCLIFFLVMASFIPSSTGLAAATLPIMVPLALFANVNEESMINIYLMALGLVKMIMPTSIVVMTCTQAAHIGYGQWVKSNWKFMILLFMVSCAFLITGVML